MKLLKCNIKVSEQQGAFQLLDLQSRVISYVVTANKRRKHRFYGTIPYKIVSLMY